MDVELNKKTQEEKTKDKAQIMKNYIESDLKREIQNSSRRRKRKRIIVS